MKVTLYILLLLSSNMILVTKVLNYQEKLVGKPTIGTSYLACMQN